jgi:hypothetical protein
MPVNIEIIYVFAYIYIYIYIYIDIVDEDLRINDPGEFSSIQMYIL